MDLIVSLPKNDIDMAVAAADAGAAALKVHMNVAHAASGTGFGTYREEVATVKAIIDAVGVPVGLMPGADPADLPEPGELLELCDYGLDFLDIYAHHMPLWFLDLPLKLVPALAAAEDDWEIYRAAGWHNAIPGGANRVHMVEASITPKAEYGQPFTYYDLARLKALHDYIDLPLLVPTQKAITPDDARKIVDAGIGAVMIGAVVTGTTADSIAEATAAFRKALST